MTVTQLSTLLDQLKQGIHPGTGRPFDLNSSCLAEPSVAAALQRFRGVVGQAGDQLARIVSDDTLRQTHRELTQLGYTPTPEQIVRVLRASRSIADRSLKAVSAYGQFRSRLSKAALTKAVASFADRNPDLFGRTPPAAKRMPKPKPAYKELPFFREGAFDKLSEEKAAELGREVEKIGLAKDTDKLPAYMAKARAKYPRAYEPWSRAEQALLIEAMCYTNDAAKIAAIFGRTANSVTDTGLKLIYRSKQQEAEAVV